MDAQDYTKLAEGLDEMREMLRSMVAMVKADGFTDEQAREIVAGYFRMAGTKSVED